MWTHTTLGEICKMYQPKTISAKEMVADGDYVVFGANGIIGKYDKYNHEQPQLLVTCRGATCGAVNVSEPHSWINGNAMVIQPDLEKVSLKFMEYLFKGGINLTTAITGAAQPQITRKSLEPIQFSYPPLAEQERIVAKLDAAFAKIDESIKNINLKEIKLDKFKSAIISDSYRGNGWDNERLGDCVSYEKNNAKGSSLPYVGMENIAPETMDLVGEIVIPEKTSSTFHFNKSHVLFGRLRPYLRKVLVPDFEGQCSTEIFCIKPKDKVIREFLAYWLLEQKISSKIEATSTGARMPRANMNALLEFDFPIPSTKEQKKIISKIDLIFTKISEAKNTLAKSKTNYFALKAAILSQELQSSEAA